MSDLVKRRMRYVYIKINKNDLNQVQAINSLTTPAVYNAELDMYQVDRDEYVQIPVLSEIPFEEIEEAQRKYDSALISHTNSIIDEEKNKIYLSTVLPKDQWIINLPENQGIFGHNGTDFYIRKQYAEDPKWHNFVARCTRKNQITATMFKPAKSKHKPTPGMVALADAFNIEDRAERAKALADACALCAKESVLKVPGALNNFVDVITISNNNTRGLNQFDSLSLASMWSESIGVYKNACKRVKKLNKPELMNFADLEAKNRCYSHVGRDLKSPIEKRLTFALKNPDPKIALALSRGALIDYVKGLSIECEGHMFYDENIKILHNSFRFGKLFNKVIDSVNKELIWNKREPLSEDFISQFSVMMELADRQCVRSQLLMNSGINSKQNVAARSFYSAQMGLRSSAYILDAEFEKMKIVKLNENKIRIREIPFLDGKKEPLFLCVRQDEREAFIKSHPELRLDPTFHALCVENTAENQKKYIDYLPRDIKQKDYINVMPQDHQRSYNRALEILSQHGFDVSKGIKVNPGQGKFTMDKKNKSLGYICNINDGGIDRIQIKDFNGQYGEKGKCILLMDEKEWKNHQQSYGTLSKEEKAAFAKEEQFRAENREALARTAQVAAAKFVNSQVSKAIDLQHEHPYLDKKELLFSDCHGLKFDKTGELTYKIMSGRNAVSEKEHLKYADSMIIPLTNADGKVMSAQMITHDGEKLFAKGAPMSGNFFTVGGYESLKKAKCVLIAEGVATAASISKIAPEGTVVVAAMNCGNLVEVTKSLSEKFPNTAIGIMADNDLKSAGVDKINAGIAHAYKASNQVLHIRPNVSVTNPPLNISELKAGLSDFNDALCHHDYDTEERYKQRVEQTKNRVFESVELAVMNHVMNKDAQRIAQNNLEKHNQEQKQIRQMANLQMVNEQKQLENIRDESEYALPDMLKNDNLTNTSSRRI